MMLFDKYQNPFPIKAEDGSRDISRHPTLRRWILNVLISILVLVKLLVCSSIFMSLVYAEYGADKLPDRIGTCFNDLSLYKRNTDAAFRTLLIDNFKELNSSLVTAISQGGSDIVEKVKKNTGNSVLDTIRNKTEVVKRLVKDFETLNNSTEEAAKNVKRLKNEWEKFKLVTTKDLQDCIERYSMPESGICRVFKDHMDTLPNPIGGIPKNMMPKVIEKTLKDYESINLIEHINRVEVPFVELEQKVQSILDNHKHIVFNKLKIAGDYLFTLAERITTQLRMLDFNKYSEVILQHIGPNSQYPVILKYTWVGFLLFASIYACNVLCYVFGILYGVFGKKADFYDTDCCSKTTGGKYLKCGVWMSILTMTILSIVTVVLMLPVTNTSNLVCLPYKDPLQRNDILSMLERIIQRTNHSSIIDGEFAVLKEGRMPSDIIRACGRNETFYKMFGLDNTYHFLDLSTYRQEFVSVEKELELYTQKITAQYNFKEFVDDQFKTALNLIPNMIDVTKWQSDLNTENLKKVVNDMELKSYITDLTGFMKTNTLPDNNVEAIKNMLGHLDTIEKDIATPLRNDLNTIIKNVDKFSSDLNQLNVNFQDIRDKLNNAQLIIVKNIRQEVSASAKAIIAQWKNDVEAYLVYVKQRMNEDITTCRPISEIAKGTVSAICNQVIDPLNGMWAAMMLYILLSIPMVVLCTAVIKSYAPQPIYGDWKMQKIENRYASNYQNPIGNAFATDAFEMRYKDPNPYGAPSEIFQTQNAKTYGGFRT
uniref:Prominin-like protein n=1 Tax=Rhabditophanes sp. KR3021 TaxID=114890 RepID=A0AC35U4P3_9BILA